MHVYLVIEKYDHGMSYKIRDAYTDKPSADAKRKRLIKAYLSSKAYRLSREAWYDVQKYFKVKRLKIK